MKRRSDPPEDKRPSENVSFETLIGLGTQSARKSHYSVLEDKINELETERNRYKWLFENALHGIFQADFEGRVRAANPAFATICGYQESQQVIDQDQPLQKLFYHPEEYARLKRELLRKGQVYRYQATFKRWNGELIYVSMNALLKTEDEEQIYEAFVLDITAYKRAQDGLARLNEELELRVATRTRELTCLNDKLLEEIREREQVEEQLRWAKEAAEEANLSKDKHLAAASHDLLQPMNAARLLVSALRERSLGEEDRFLVERIHLALEGAEELLSDLLYISKLDQNAVRPQPEVFSVQQLLSGLETEFQPIAARSGLQLKLHFSDLFVASDPHFLGRILRNFISNALRYTERGRVVVGCRRRGDKVSIQVWDTGEGVPDEHLQEIFQEFYQVNDHHRGSGGRQGVGLGLAIVDRLAHLLEHPIKVRSWRGKGSMFSVEVPAAERPPLAVDRLGAPVHSGNLAGACVLVLDNDENILLSMQVLLKQWRCDVHLARDKEEAIRLCKTGSLRPDVILADYHLDDEQSGTDAVLAMRACAGEEIPAAIITADYSDELGQLFKRLNLPRLNKPVKAAKLRALLSHLLQ